MSVTVIESRCKALMDGFEMAIHLFSEEAGKQRSYDKKTRFHSLIIEDSEPLDNATYTLEKSGLKFKHSGVVV